MTTATRLFVSTFLVACTLTAGSAARAGDGVVEINHTCALNIGCFDGDPAGYPVVINGAAGLSYRLTSDLIVTEGDNGVRVEANNVSLDLGGFEIVRAGCAGSTTDCTPVTGSSSGISIPFSPTIQGTSVSNGSVTGMAAFGLALGPASEVRNVQVRWNRLNGISTNRDSIVAGSRAYENGSSGISVGTGSKVSGCTAYSNGILGIAGSNGVTIVDSASYLNATGGITAGSGAVVSRSSAYNNGSIGIEVGASSTVTGNAAHTNGLGGIDAFTGSTISNNAVEDNDGNGIACNEGCAVTGNTSYSNNGIGIRTQDGAVITGNTVSNSDEHGIDAGTGSVIRGNVSFDNGQATAGDGIVCELGCRVDGNTARDNSNVGMSFGSASTGYSDNTVGGNTNGTVSGGTDRGGNICELSLTCP